MSTNTTGVMLAAERREMRRIGRGLARELARCHGYRQLPVRNSPDAHAAAWRIVGLGGPELIEEIEGL